MTWQASPGPGVGVVIELARGRERSFLRQQPDGARRPAPYACASCFKDPEPGRPELRQTHGEHHAGPANSGPTTRKPGARACFFRDSERVRHGCFPPGPGRSGILNEL